MDQSKLPWCLVKVACQVMFSFRLEEIDIVREAMNSACFISCIQLWVGYGNSKCWNDLRFYEDISKIY